MTGDATPSARTLQLVEDIGGLRDVWTELATLDANVFSTWEWATVWLRHLEGVRRLLVHVERDEEERVVMLLPLYLWSARPFRIARFLGHGPADQLGPLARGSRGDAVRALRNVVSQARLDLLFAELLPGHAEWSGALGRRPLVRESSPKIALGSGWDAYLSTRSSNMRQQIRSRERRLHRRHEVRFRLSEDPARLQGDLTTLFDLHALRWGARSAFTRWERFHREFAAVALERGWLRLWVLELDDRPAAAWYGFRFAGVESYYQAGRDPRRADEAVGFVLLAHTIREAASDGQREYRLLRGAEAFKRRFADDDPGLESVAIARGVRGRIASAAVEAGLRSAALRRVARRVDGLLRRRR